MIPPCGQLTELAFEDRAISSVLKTTFCQETFSFGMFSEDVWFAELTFRFLTSQVQRLKQSHKQET